MVSTEKNLDFTDIFMNQTKIQEIFNKQESRQGRFGKQLLQNHKSYGNKIFKKRHDEYFDNAKEQRYKTPFLRLRENQRINLDRLTKAQKRKQIEMLEQRRNKKTKLIINYIKAYPDDAVPVSGENLLKTMTQMGSESVNLFDTNQKQPNFTTKFLIEQLAAIKLNQMSSKQVVDAIGLAQATSAADIQEKNQKALRRNKSAAPGVTNQQSKQQNSKEPTPKNVFSFEDRFKAFVGLKVQDNMELLQEKRLAEYNAKVSLMLNADIDENFTNAEFRSYVDNSNPDNMLVDLTHQFIHRAIEVGHKKHQIDQQTRLQNEPNLGSQHNSIMESQRRSVTINQSSIESQRGGLSSVMTSQRNVADSTTHVLFQPKLGINFQGVKSLYDIKDREALFSRVQFVLQHMDKDRFIKFRNGQLSMPQCISRIEAESKNGIKYTVLDDLKHDLDPNSLKKPSKAIMQAYQEQVIEDRLLRGAKKRGIDPVILKKTARNLNVQERCAKSMYTKAKVSEQLAITTRQAFKIEQIKRENVFARKKEIDKTTHQQIVEKAQEKEKRSQAYMKELAKQDRREIMRESAECKAINEKLHNTKYYFLPEHYRKALLAEFHETYEQEVENFETKKGSKYNEPAVIHRSQSMAGASAVRSISSNALSKGIQKRQKLGAVAPKEPANDGLDWLEDLGFPEKLDDDTRQYLKRLKVTYPEASICIPEGYYDSDEEEERNKKLQIAKKMSSRFIAYEIDQDGNILETEKVSPKKKLLSQKKLSQKMTDLNPLKPTEKQDSSMQYLGARSISVTQEQQESSVTQLSNTAASNPGLLKVTSDGAKVESTRHSIQLAVLDDMESAPSSIADRRTATDQIPTLENNYRTHGGDIAVIGEFTDNKLNEQEETTDMKQCKRTVSAMEIRDTSTLDMIETNRVEDYRFNHESRNTDLQGNHQQNFPISVLKKTHVLRNEAGSATAKLTIDEPIMLDQSPGFKPEKRLFKNVSQPSASPPNRRHFNRSSLFNQSLNRTMNQKSQMNQKELSQETLVIGGLIKRPSTILRNKSALSKEYHQRHTRHIRGQSALAKSYQKDETVKNDSQSQFNNKKRPMTRTSLYSTKMTNKQSQKDSIHFSETRKNVPESVLTWYKEMIGHKWQDPKERAINQAGRSDYNAIEVLIDKNAANQTQPLTEHSADFGQAQSSSSHNHSKQRRPQSNSNVFVQNQHMKKSMTINRAKQKLKKVALVGHTPFMTLNQDIINDDIDFAFTVQQKKGTIASSTKYKSERENFSHAQTQDRTVVSNKQKIYNSYGAQPNSMNQSSLISGSVNKKSETAANNNANNYNSSGPMKTFDMTGPKGSIQQDAIIALELQDQLNDKHQSQQQSTGYNWLTGVPMSGQNQQNLQKVSHNLCIDQTGGARFYVNEKAPRQLLVNESVLRRNQMYRQQSAGIQTTSRAIEIQPFQQMQLQIVNQEASHHNIKYIHSQDPSTPGGKTEFSDQIKTGNAIYNPVDDGYSPQLPKQQQANRTLYDQESSEQNKDYENNQHQTASGHLLKNVRKPMVMTGFGSTERADNSVQQEASSSNIKQSVIKQRNTRTNGTNESHQVEQIQSSRPSTSELVSIASPMAANQSQEVLQVRKPPASTMAKTRITLLKQANNSNHTGSLHNDSAHSNGGINVSRHVKPNANEVRK